MEERKGSGANRGTGLRILMFAVALACGGWLDGAAAQPAIGYPPAIRGAQVDSYHGVTVADPYRWLERGDSDSTRAWIDAQKGLADPYLRSLPDREAIRERLAALWSFDRWDLPRRHGSRYFLAIHEAGRDQEMLVIREPLGGPSRTLLDPNSWSSDATVSLSGWVPSDDGRLLAYSVSDAGSDWSEWRILDVATGKDLGDTLRWTKFSAIAWSPDAAGFYYSRYDPPAAGAELEGRNENQKLCYHAIGAPQSADRIVYERPDHPEWGFDGQVTEDGRLLLIYVWTGREKSNAIFLRPLDPPGEIVPLLPDFDALYTFLGNDGPVLWFRTDRDAPRGRIVAVDLRSPAREAWRELIPEQAEPIESASVVGDRFFVVYLQDAHSVVRRFRLDGTREADVALPSIGTAHGFGGRREHDETFFGFTSYTSPQAVYRVAVDDGRTELLHTPDIGFRAEEHETREFFYPSRDGTRVPIFLTMSRRAWDRGEPVPIWLTGYGGFRASMTPWFSVSKAVWMERGGAVAVACLRGGGEYGEAWHEAGSRLEKQNTFDDFIAAAEWLVSEGWAEPAGLAIAGGSNGGLLVGACLVQRPDLFGAAIVANGVLDMLRYHLFTVGQWWISDYGTPEDPEEFRVLRSYSPVHNVRPGVRYPATLITTADHDDRVVPVHSFKFAAALQAAQAGTAPVLLRVETRAGHGAGTPISKRIEEEADMLAFAAAALRAAGAVPPVPVPGR